MTSQHNTTSIDSLCMIMFQIFNKNVHNVLRSLELN